jgi:hypothetical protein
LTIKAIVSSVTTYFWLLDREQYKSSWVLLQKRLLGVASLHLCPLVLRNSYHAKTRRRRVIHVITVDRRGGNTGIGIRRDGKWCIEAFAGCLRCNVKATVAFVEGNVFKFVNNGADSHG